MIEKTTALIIITSLFAIGIGILVYGIYCIIRDWNEK